MQYQENLSAFLDGELSETDTRKIESALETDTRLQAELASLIEADQLAKEEFAALVDEPLPRDLVKSIQNAPETPVANSPAAPTRRANWLTAMAASVALAIGGVGGFLTGSSQPEQQVAAPGWLQDIADYHEVYADQKRHLVEVAASERDHIQVWLSTTLGTDVRVPDLSENGLEFQGARLLVAAGKPVAQLMYLDADQRVVALCQIQSASPRDGFADQTIGDFDLVSWGGETSNFVVVGDDDRGDLVDIARTAASQV
ncbi:anti-sigma factor family protein [Roseobacter sp. EG26]|uniref:anti-sigma factor family protein n=1 Tax=Roseobacter sp. EG26 TaxID=3412477 RepID=UPI003CE4C7D1